MKTFILLHPQQLKPHIISFTGSSLWRVWSACCPLLHLSPPIKVKLSQGRLEGGVTDAGKAPCVPPQNPSDAGSYPIWDNLGQISLTGDPKLGQGIMGHPPCNLREGAKKWTKRATWCFCKKNKKTFSWGVFNSHSLNCRTPECSIGVPVQWDVGDPRWENGGGGPGCGASSLPPAPRSFPELLVPWGHPAPISSCHPRWDRSHEEIRNGTGSNRAVTHQ